MKHHLTKVPSPESNGTVGKADELQRRGRLRSVAASLSSLWQAQPSVKSSGDGQRRRCPHHSTMTPGTRRLPPWRASRGNASLSAHPYRYAELQIMRPHRLPALLAAAWVSGVLAVRLSGL